MIANEGPANPIRLYLGGTFNPVHLGHMRLALECRAQFKLARLAFVPARVPPHKKTPKISNQYRLDMLAMAVLELNAIAGDYFEMNTSEMERQGASYTVDTLAHLRKLYSNDTLVWIIGMDSWLSLNTWHNWRGLLDYGNLLVVNRPGFASDVPQELADFATGKVFAPNELPVKGGIAFVNTTPMNIASSNIRQLVRQAHSPAFLVSEPVRQFINQHQLYSE